MSNNKSAIILMSFLGWVVLGEPINLVDVFGLQLQDRGVEESLGLGHHEERAAHQHNLAVRVAHHQHEGLGDVSPLEQPVALRMPHHADAGLQSRRTFSPEVLGFHQVDEASKLLNSREGFVNILTFAGAIHHCDRLPLEFSTHHEVSHLFLCYLWLTIAAGLCPTSRYTFLRPAHLGSKLGGISSIRQGWLAPKPLSSCCWLIERFLLSCFSTWMACRVIYLFSD